MWGGPRLCWYQLVSKQIVCFFDHAPAQNDINNENVLARHSSWSKRKQSAEVSATTLLATPFSWSFAAPNFYSLQHQAQPALYDRCSIFPKLIGSPRMEPLSRPFFQAHFCIVQLESKPHPLRNIFGLDFQQARKSKRQTTSWDTWKGRSINKAAITASTAQTQSSVYSDKINSYQLGSRFACAEFDWWRNKTSWSGFRSQVFCFQKSI